MNSGPNYFTLSLILNTESATFFCLFVLFFGNSPMSMLANNLTVSFKVHTRLLLNKNIPPLQVTNEVERD